MLIISKKKDYYDGVVGTMGIDKTIVYDRQIIEFEDKNIPELFYKKFYGLYGMKRDKNHPFYKLTYHHIKKEYQKKYPHFSYFIIGFCGKIYVGWKLYSEGKNYYNEFNPLITEITYDFDYMKTLSEPKGWIGDNFEDDVKYIKNYNALDLFRELKTPVFVYDNDYDRKSLDKYWHHDNHKFIVNPLLKNYEFYKIFDTFQTFQEIQMFLSGVLGAGEKEIIEVADKYKITQHGFDYKWSFRREPTKKT
jgi:hypothetical protein